MKRLVLACAFALIAACGGDNSPPADAPAAGSFGATCTTPSDMSTECDSGICTDSFDMLGHAICSQKCTLTMSTDPSCPAGTSQKCNQKGYCKP